MNQKTIRNFLTQKIERISIANKKRREELLKQIPEVRSLFTKYPTVEKAWLFGSILDEELFDESSDVDIAVKGLDNGSYFSLFADLSQIVGENLDIVEIERIRWAETILDEGLIIYEKR